jgi:hypothetical protein
MKYQIQNIDPVLWQKFKLFCVSEKISMNKKILKMVKEEIERAERRYGSGRR